MARYQELRLVGQTKLESLEKEYEMIQKRMAVSAERLKHSKKLLGDVENPRSDIFVSPNVQARGHLL